MWSDDRKLYLMSVDHESGKRRNYEEILLCRPNKKKSKIQFDQTSSACRRELKLFFFVFDTIKAL